MLWNLAGQGLPLIAAIAVLPVLTRGLGAERFGILALSWVLLGYFSLFDLGIGRALTQLVATRLAQRQTTDLQTVVWTALTMMLVLGVAAGLVIAVLTPWVVNSVVKIQPHFRREASGAFYVMAVGVPIVILTTGLRGVLEGYQRFDLANVARLPLGIFTYLLPAGVLIFTSDVVSVIASLVVMRVATMAAYFLLCLHVMPKLRVGIIVRRANMGPLARLGGWMSVSNVVSPLMSYMDRFLISALVSVTAVAYYATPNEMVTKLLFIPSALSGVLLPAFAGRFVADKPRVAVTMQRSIRYLVVCFMPITLLIVVTAHMVLQKWLGPEYSSHSTTVLQWLAIGMMLNSLAQLPFALLQGIGRPDLTAKVHIIELPVYLIALLWLLSVRGIDGAAIAWTMRAGVDMILLYIIANRVLAPVRALSNETIALMSLALAIPCLALAWSATPGRLPYLVLAAAVMLLLSFGLPRIRAVRESR